MSGLSFLSLKYSVTHSL